MNKALTWRKGKYFIGMAPWDWVAEPYFSVGMGYIYKETTIEEAKKSVNFKVFQPLYRPSAMPIYRVAINVEPKSMANSEVYFFTPRFPGTEHGTEPIGGLLIKESLAEEELPKNATKSIVSGTEVSIFSLSPQKGWGFYFKKEGTGIAGSWFGKDANKSELLKIAKSIISSS